MKPRLAITIGDVNGIGPEIAVKAFQAPDLLKLCRPLIVGSVQALDGGFATTVIDHVGQVVGVEGDALRGQCRCGLRR